VLPCHGAGVVLPTVAEGGLLRGRAGGVTDLRLSVMLRASTAEGLSLSGVKARVQRGRRRLKAMILQREARPRAGSCLRLQRR
jgi:hypothetical protein